MRISRCLKIFLVVAILGGHKYSTAMQSPEFHLFEKIYSEITKKQSSIVDGKMSWRQIEQQILERDRSFSDVYEIIDSCDPMGPNDDPFELRDILLVELPKSPLALHVAAAHGLDSLVDFLAKEKPDLLNKFDGNGATPLHYAVSYNQVTTVRLLVESGVAVDVKDYHGSTALHIAAKSGFNEIAGILIEQMKSLVDAEDLMKRTPLHLAAEQKDIETLRVLLDYRPQINALNYELDTAMDSAIRGGYFENARLLSKKGGVIKKSGKAALAQDSHPYRSLLLYSEEAIRFDNLAGASCFGNMSSRALNIGASSTQDVQTMVKFDAIDGEPALYKITFSPNQKAAKTLFEKTMIVRAVASTGDAHRLASLRFMAKEQRGYQEKRSSTFEGEQIYKTVKGKRIINDKIVRFEKEIPVEYSKDYQSIVLKFIGSNSKPPLVENVLLSRDPKSLREPTISLEKRLSQSAVASNNGDQSNAHPYSLNTPSINRPYLEEVLGEFSGKASNGWDIISVSLVSKSESSADYELIINTQNHGVTRHDVALIMEGDKVAKLTFPNKKMQFHNWLFLNEFIVELKSNCQITLACYSAKRRGGQNQLFSFALDKSSSTLVACFHQKSSADFALAKGRSDISGKAREELGRQEVRIDDDPEMDGLSKRQRKREARRDAREERTQTIEEAWSSSLPFKDDDDERNRRNREQVQRWHARQIDSVDEENYSDHEERENFKANSAKLMPGKDWNELTKKSDRVKIKLNPGRVEDCPLLSGVWYGDGYTDNGAGLELVENKKLVLSLRNVKGRQNTANWGWGSLWASSLGIEGNFSLGKDVHWSYHQQGNGVEYLNISHHYLFDVRPSSKLGWDFELRLIKAAQNKFLKDVTVYFVKKVEQENISEFAAKHIGFNPNIKKEQELEREQLDILFKVRRQLIGDEFNLQISGIRKIISWDHESNAFVEGKAVPYNIYMTTKDYGVIELIFEKNSDNNNNMTEIEAKFIEFELDSDDALHLIRK